MKIQVQFNENSSSIQWNSGSIQVQFKFNHRAPTQSVCVTGCNFIMNVLDSPFASSLAIYR